MKNKLLRIFFALLLFVGILPTSHAIIDNNNTVVEAVEEETTNAYNIWLVNQKGFNHSNQSAPQDGISDTIETNLQPKLTISNITCDSGYDINDLKS